MQKNGVKMHQRMDSKQEEFLNLRLNLSMTKFMLNPGDFPKIWSIIGLVLGEKKVANLFTETVKIIWNFKIGAEINQLKNQPLKKAVSSPKMGNGLILVATESIISFVNLSNWCWILLSMIVQW